MDALLPQTVQQLLDSYRRIGGINNIDGVNLPSKRAVAGLCEDLLRLLFPGFHDCGAIHSSDLQATMTRRLGEFAAALQAEVAKSLRMRSPAEAAPPVPAPFSPAEAAADDRQEGEPNAEAEAERIVSRMLQWLPAVRDLLWTDVEAAYEGDPASVSFDEIILAYPCLEAIAIQRCAHTLYRQRVPLIPRMMTEWAHSRTGIDIHPGAQIGSHFFIDHGTGVVIGETCVIGSHVKLYHGVTLGAKSFQKDEEGHILKGGQRHPRVEENVTIYPNSTVLGGATVIGAGSTIGGNVFLQQSVPAGSLVYYEETQLKMAPKPARREPESVPQGSTLVGGPPPPGNDDGAPQKSTPWSDWSI